MTPIHPLDLVGFHIKLLDIQNNEIEGDVYAYDPNLELLILYESGDQHATSRRKSFRTIHVNKGIKQIISMEKPTTPNVPFYDTPLPSLNLQKIGDSLDKALEERKKKIGTGVTNRAQHIFDVISKTIPSTWDEKENGTIVLIDGSRITAPYGPENVSGCTDQSSALVKKILEGEQAKLEKELEQLRLKAQNKSMGDGNRKEWIHKKKPVKQ